MAEASSTAISSSPCHLGGITRLAFAPDGQYVSSFLCSHHEYTPLHHFELLVSEVERDERLTYRTIFTGGSDCLVRIHKANEPDSEPGFHDNHEDAVTSLTCEVSRGRPDLEREERS
jgi:chromosome transmission fidelity protein 4